MNSLLAACGMENERDIKVDFMALLRVLKLVDEVDARHNLGISMGFSPATRSLFPSEILGFWMVLDGFR